MTSPFGPVADARILRPLRDFLHTEAAGGLVLVAATAVALVWANSPFGDSYRELWESTFTVALGSHVLTLDLRAWVNDGLMTVFFFVVGLEIKRELVVGELRDRRTAALPAIAALGGMVVPALLYLARNAGGDGARGWGIPMATDIAMAVGVLGLLGSRINPSLKLFLLALAIVDDIGAIAVIAAFYSQGLDAGAVAVALALVAMVVVMRVVGLRAVWPYVVVGAVLWIAVHESGVHATVTGVVLGLATPTRAPRSQETVDVDKLTDVSTVETAKETTVLARESVPIAEWLEYGLHPWSSYVIVPLFALANAGVVLSSSSVEHAVESPVTQGVALGLVLGKMIGITTFAWLACRLGVASLPDGARWREIVGVGMLAGIGFTVSIFVSGLAFGSGRFDTDAKIGILAASVVAAALGCALLLRAGRAEEPAR